MRSIHQGDFRFPAVSVLTPAFNSRRFIAAAIESLLSQTFRDFEFILLDDGSPDGLLEIIERFAKQDPRLRFISRSNKGLVASRNELLANARGKYIAWMDSDDISLPHRLEMLCARLDADPVLACVGSFAQAVDPDGVVLGVEKYHLDHSSIRADQMKGHGMRFPTTMVRRDLALSVGGFRSSFKIGEDLDFLLRVGERGRLANVGEVLYLYRQHLGNTSNLQANHWPLYRDIILRLAAERRDTGQDALMRGEPLASLPVHDPDVPPDYQTYLCWSRLALQNGSRSNAFKYALLALKSGFLTLRCWKNLLRVFIR